MVLATKKNCQRVLAASLRVVSAMTGNPPLVWKLVNYQSISDNHETGKIKFGKNWQKLSSKMYLKLDYQLTFTH